MAAITSPEIIKAKSLIHSSIKDISTIKMFDFNQSFIKMNHQDIGFINTIHKQRSVIGQIKA